MAYNDDGDTSREDLYRRFRKSLKEPASERFFDEDELVEIFDYAGDIDDLYARIEVLCCGARLYPDSKALADRRALLYLDEDDSDSLAKAFLDDNKNLSSPLVDIVSLEINRPGPDAAPAALEFLLSQYDSFTDEEIIRFVDLAVDLGQYQWLIADLDILRTKVHFLPSLLYEILNEADSRNDFATAISLAEELIELEPFSVTYWGALFRAHARAGHEAEARSSFDYAKALAADNPPAIEWLCDTVLYHASYLRHDALELLDSVIDDRPDDFRFVDYRCGMMMQSGQTDAAIEGIKTFLERNPDNITALQRLLSINAPGAARYVEAYYNAVPAGFGESMLENIVNTLHMQGALSSLNDFLSVACQHETISIQHFAPWIEALFAQGKFDRIINMIDVSSLEPIVNIPLKGAATAAAVVLSYMKLGKQEEAEKFIAATRPDFEAILENSPLPIRMSIRALLSVYDSVARHPASDRLFWDYYDPFGYGKFA